MSDIPPFSRLSYIEVGLFHLLKLFKIDCFEIQYRGNEMLASVVGKREVAGAKPMDSIINAFVAPLSARAVSSLDLRGKTAISDAYTRRLFKRDAGE